MPMVNGQWTSIISKGKPQSQKNLANQYRHYVCKFHNKLAVLLQKNGHIRHDKATVEAIEQLLKLICIFVNQPAFCSHTHCTP